MSADPENKIVVDGILAPYSWSRGYSINRIALHSAGEKEFLIDLRNKKGRELKASLGNRALITGRFSGKKSSPKSIIVESYRIIDW